MNITLYVNKRTNKEGKVFTSYYARLTKKDGDQIVCSVNFIDGVIPPKEFPCNIVVEETDMSFTAKNYISSKTRKEIAVYTLWIAKYTDCKPYVDHSLDDFK